jgi:hypothetical protein
MIMEVRRSWRVEAGGNYEPRSAIVKPRALSVLMQAIAFPVTLRRERKRASKGDGHPISGKPEIGFAKLAQVGNSRLG